MKVDLRDQVALVTGAANGIGKAIAEILAANEARVIFTDIDFAAAKESASCVPRAKAMELDVCSESQIQAVTTEIMREYGRVDILVNNAGVNTNKHRVPFDQFPRDEWDRIVQVDLTGVYLVGKAVGGIMRARQSGRIINIASVAGLVPLRLQCAYVASKAGVINLTKTMALEIGCEGITVNAIAPGSTLTNATKSLFYGEDGQFKDSVRKLLDHIPCGRPGRPEEIAAAALFLAAPEASYVNGAVITVDGGWTAGYAREF
ncbi:MAG: 3-oxoacyl-ACP reductase FabG [Planctomycetes bacterium]|nr:3-oxoacyl-ACP reductase FabG [Planctomycetota bacterium]MBU4399848.1 3-oxoacyl-ACP reductase FabG [Planctomycetota bacterium]MCG2685176.1 3-oxoacyl-ACP reductase FabG [Planctomycetales bacterium]